MGIVEHQISENSTPPPVSEGISDPPPTGRFTLPGTTFMRRSREPRLWHLGPPWADSRTESRCNIEGPWLVMQAGVQSPDVLCVDCLRQAGLA